MNPQLKRQHNEALNNLILESRAEIEALQWLLLVVSVIGGLSLIVNGIQAFELWIKPL